MPKNRLMPPSGAGVYETIYETHTRVFYDEKTQEERYRVQKGRNMHLIRSCLLI